MSNNSDSFDELHNNTEFLTVNESGERRNETDLIPSGKCGIQGDLLDKVLFYKFILIPVFCCILCLALNLKRKRLWFTLCYGRPGLIYPINLMQGEDNRISLVASFVFLGWVMLDYMINKTCNSPFYVTEMHENLGPFYSLLSFIIFAFIFYPLFAALTAGSILGYLLGTLYSWTLGVVSVMDGIQRTTFKTSTWDIYVIKVAGLMPPCLCIIYLCLIFPYRLITRLFFKRIERIVGPSVAPHAIYVKHLFQQNKIQKNNSKLIEKIKTFSWIYVPVPGFKYSTSLMAAVSMGVCFMYMYTIATLEKFYMLFELNKRLLRRPEALHDLTSNPIILIIASFLKKDPDEYAAEYLNEQKFWWEVFEGCLYTILTISFLSVLYCLLSTMKNYRRHMLNIYRGSQDDIKHFNKLNVSSIVINGVKFVGYQVAYATWGFIIQVIFFGVAIFAAVSFVVVLIRYNLFEVIIMWMLRKLWPWLVCFLLLKLTQNLMVRFCFITRGDRGQQVLAIDNRRLFFNFYYFAIFGNIAIGLVSALLRIIKGAIAGLISIPRLDRSTMSRHFENWDPGHASYVGLLYLEHVYRNPIMLAFVDILTENRCSSSSIPLNRVTYVIVKPGKEMTKAMSKPVTISFRRAQMRWQVALTLLNNEELIINRKKVLKKRLQAPPSVRETNKFGIKLKNVLKHKILRPNHC